jgi:hypothetical protein
MRIVYSEFLHLWPTSSLHELEPILSKVSVVFFPQDKDVLRKVVNPGSTIVVVEDADLKDMSLLLDAGFLHLLQKSRKDFSQELLIASLMIVKPEAFVRNPIPFFFSGGLSAEKAIFAGTVLQLNFTSSFEKPMLLDELRRFLFRHPQLEAVSDLCGQVADELITNACFGAPTKANGAPMYQDRARTDEVIVPTNKRATFFACYSDYRIVIGCQDRYGSIRPQVIREHLVSTFKQSKAAPKSLVGGAGLGFKYMIENSANFYLFCEQSLTTLVACGFLLEGLRANVSPKKHIHFSFHEK